MEHPELRPDSEQRAGRRRAIPASGDRLPEHGPGGEQGGRGRHRLLLARAAARQIAATSRRRRSSARCRSVCACTSKASSITSGCSILNGRPSCSKTRWRKAGAKSRRTSWPSTKPSVAAGRCAVYPTCSGWKPARRLPNRRNRGTTHCPRLSECPPRPGRRALRTPRRPRIARIEDGKRFRPALLWIYGCGWAVPLAGTRAGAGSAAGTMRGLRVTQAMKCHQRRLTSSQSE